ncbi:MAG: hypothetical protein IJ251_02425 [Oscillospiraceae bacterium]|nr:hypothetical protein [Oscillospiraceae bacterium]
MSVQDIQRRQRDLLETVEILQMKLSYERRSIANENKQKLREMSQEFESRLTEHDRQTDEAYRRILGKFTSAKQTEIADEIGRLRREYDDLETQMNRELAAEQQKNEEMLLRSRRFEEAYNARRDFAKARAEQSVEKLMKRFSEVTENVPTEFFLHGHQQLYRRRIQDVDSLMRMGLYESVIGICDDMLMQLEFDVIETEDRFDKWFHYFTVLRQLIADEENRFKKVHHLPDELELLGRSLRSENGYISDEQLDRWSDDGYSRLHREYDSIALSSVTELPTDRDMIRSRMIEHPDMASEISDIYLYDRIQAGLSRRGEQNKVFDLMYSRMSAWVERVKLYIELRPAMKEEGYSCTLSDEGEDHVVTFTDDMSVHKFELILIPVRRRSDDRYVNTAVCFSPMGIDASRRDEIVSMVAGVLVTQGIDVEHRQMSPDQTTGMRVREANADKILQINGRMN